jgi:Kef-type K+ transport system membrane component KefB
MTIPLILGILFLIGLAADLLGRSTFLPRVTVLMLSGFVVGPSGLSLLPRNFIDDWFPPMTNIALALIGFLLGHRLALPELKKHGSTIVGISLCKVFGASIVVALGLLLIGMDPVIVVLLAGIAPATAPAAMYDVVHESGASGDFVDTLLSVVALDDVWGLLIFIMMMACAGVLSGNAMMTTGIAEIALGIGGGVLLGVALGVPMAYLTGRIRRGEPLLSEAMGFVMLSAGLAEWFEFVPVLTAMVMGMVVATLAKHHDRPFHAIEGIEWPFMILFFVLAGASLRVDTLLIAGGLTAAYVVSRFIGIYIGARLGCRLMGAQSALRKWLGLALLPQAGVAIGMALMAAQRFPEAASIVLTVVVAATVILETIGPIVARQAIRAATASGH